MSNDNKGYGYLFPVEKKESEKHPDYKGKTTLNDQQYLVSGWIREKDGNKMIVMSLTLPEDMPGYDPSKAKDNNSQNNKFNNQSQEKNAPSHQEPPKQTASQQQAATSAPSHDSDDSEDAVDDSFGDIFDDIDDSM